MNATADHFQLFDPLTDEEYRALRDDIALRGVLVPVELDETGAILDGHHRVRACEELGITDYPRIVRSGLGSDEAKRTHVRAINLLRRHLTQEQRRRAVADQLRDTPEKSNRQIGADLGVSDHTVGAVRTELEASAQITQIEDRKVVRSGQEFTQRPRKARAILATTPAEERQAIAAAPTAPEGFFTAHEADQEVRKEQARAEALESARLLSVVGDPDGNVARASLRAAFSAAVATASKNLLSLDPAEVSRVIEGTDLYVAQRFVERARRWLDAFDASRRAGIHAVESDSQ